MRNNRGISFIELILFIVIMGLAVPSLLIAATNMFDQSMNLESFHVSTNLAGGIIEDLKGRRFDSVVEESETHFTGQFNRYQYHVHVNYVDSANLDLSVDPVVTDFKRVQVTVEDTSFLGRETTFSTVITND